MSLIQTDHLTFTHEGNAEPVFDGLSMQLDTDWKTGVIGRNGRGKTTFLRLLHGDFAYSGGIYMNVACDYFPFPVDNPGRPTAQLIQTFVPAGEEWQLERELNLLEVSPDVLERPFAALSGGEQTKVLLAALFLREDHFLLIDEPTNHLDRHAREVVSRYLRRKHGFLLVSHDRAFLDGCVDHILSFERTGVKIQRGNYSSWNENRQRQEQFERSQDRKLRKDISRLETAAARTSNWSDKMEKTKRGTRNSGLRPDTGYIGHRSAKMMKRSKAIEARQQAAIDEKSQLLHNMEQAPPLRLSPLRYCVETLAELKQVSIRYDGRDICCPVDLTISRGDCVALVGKNGAGKSSLLKLLCGAPVDYSGRLYIGSGLRISYVPQDTSFLTGGLESFACQRGIDRSLFYTILRKLDFSRTLFEQDMRTYSAGQKKKVLLAASLCEQAHLYLWDEPLNYIDIDSRIQIEELLKQYRPTMLLVEHDRAFCDAVAARTVELV